jgi:hypothetical protein
MEDSLYRRNPARDVEAFAITTLRYWMDDLGTVEDTSHGHGPDFTLAYADGRRGTGEVGWHEDPMIQEMWARTFQAPCHQQVDLAAGLGQWSVALVRGAHIGRLYAELPGFVDMLVAQGCLRLEVQGGWPRGDLADAARHLGIEHIDQVTSAEPSVAIFFMPGSGGAITDDPDVITDWVEEVLDDPHYRDTTEKLLRIEADERHVFLMSGTLTSFDVDQNLQRVAARTPSRPPAVSPGITHVWVVSRFGEPNVGLWTNEQGWSCVAIPPTSQQG